MPSTKQKRATWRTPRHRASTRRRVSLKGTLTSLVAVTTGTCVALAGVGGTYAVWNGEGQIDPTTISSGILDLDVTGSLDSSQWSTLLPGEHHVQFVVVENTGNIPLELSALATQTGGDSGSFELRLELVDDSSSCTSPILGADALGATVGLGTMLPSAVSHLCVDVTLSATALPGDDAALAVALTADQES